MHLHSKHNAGFSLLQVALLLSVASIIVVSILPGGNNSSDLAKDAITMQRMQKIEEATQAFMAKNLRRPCPASGVGGTYTENTNAGCSGANFTNVVTHTATGASGSTLTVDSASGIVLGSYVSNAAILSKMLLPEVAGISGTDITLNVNAANGSVVFNSTVAGTVPTRSLGLPDEYALDGYGRRLMYIVDTRATSPSLCRDMQQTGHVGDVRIKNRSTDTAAADKVMWALMSYGKDGHGAFPANGGAVANRFDTGATDADTASNAFAATGNMGTSTFTGAIVKKEKTTGFDDVVWTQEATKNTCCIGKACGLGARLDNTKETITATGDINGDGITDLILGSPTDNQIYVVFGKKMGWPLSPPPLSGLDVTVLSNGANNHNGFVIYNNNSYSNFAATLAVGDVNGDGVDDVVIGSGNGTSSQISMVMGKTTPFSNLEATSAGIITLPAATGNTAPQIALGDFNGDGKKDVLALVSITSAYVIYGKTSPAAMTITAESSALTVAAPATGFKITKVTQLGTDGFNNLGKVGDLNGDGKDDIIITGTTKVDNVTYNNKGIPIVGTTGYVIKNQAYVLFGRADWNNPAITAAVPGVPGTPAQFDISSQSGNHSTGVTFQANASLSAYTVADINRDGYGDLLINNGNYLNVYNGKSSGWGDSVIDLDTASNFNDKNVGFRIDVGATWTKPAIVGDVNNDGLKDIIISNIAANTNAGSAYVLFQSPTGWFSQTSSGTLTLFGSGTEPFDNSGNARNVANSFRIDGGVASDSAYAAAIADFNYDGKNDILLPALGHSSSAGAAYILYGRSTVPWDATINLGDLN